MRVDEYVRHDAVGLSELVAQAEVTPADLQRCALEAIDAVQPQVNAVVATHPHDEDALPEGGPLRGVPTLVKDLFHGQVGLPCGNGSRLQPDWTVPSRSLLFSRVEAAGLVSVGRSTTSEFGIMGTTETLACGATSSPVAPGRIAGGSSGGAAAAVGSGMVPVALASDGGGSIRIPAAACGTVGLKPSRGRVPWGLRQREPLLGWAVQFAVTRSVRDTALLLDLLSGPAPYDAEGLPRHPTPFADTATGGAEPLRIAWTADPWSGHDADPVVAAATEATARQLEALGHEVEQATPTFDWDTYLQAMGDVWAATNAYSIDGFAKAIGAETSDQTLEGTTLAMVEHGRTITAGRLERAMDVEAALTVLMAGFFAEHDVLLTPTLGGLLPELGHYDQTAGKGLHDTFAEWSKWECFLPVFNTTGLPAISLPLHVSDDGLPIGMQLVSGFGREDVLLRLAADLEQALPWRDRVPPVWAGGPA